MSRRPTLADVAREAGVSSATVDRVLNGRLPVRAGTTQRVIAAAERIGYHAAALMRERQHEGGVRRTLAFCLQKRSDPFYRALAEALQSACESRHPTPCIARISFQEALEPAAIADQLREAAQAADAVAVVAVDHPHVNAAIAELHAQGKPVFTLLSDLSAPERAGYVGVDARHSGRTVAWLLSRLAAPGPFAVFLGSHRYLGQEAAEGAFRSWLREHAPQRVVLDTQVNLEDERLAYEALQSLLAREPGLAGLYVAGGGVPGIVRALREHPDHVVSACTELMPDRRAAMIDGVLDLVLVSPRERIATTAVARMLEAVQCAAEGRPWPVAQSFTQPFELHTPENL